jgi:sulfate permease, SulP family
LLSTARSLLWRPRKFDLFALGRDAVSGFIGATVQVAYCISFSALIFQGALAPGFSLGLAALLVGTVITGVVVALTTTLSPATGGPDTPAIAVLSVLASSIAASLSDVGLSVHVVIINALVAITVATVLSGLFLFSLGALRLGKWLRFVPYPVVAGFLAGSGVLMIAGGAEMITETNLSLSPDSWAHLYSPTYVPQLFVALLFALLIGVLRRSVSTSLALPIAFAGCLVLLDVALFGVVHDEALRRAWFLPSVGKLELWWPLGAVTRPDIDWGALARNAANIGAVSWITAISMLLDVSSLEVARQKSADLDKELRTNGLANVAAGVLGGVGGNLSLNGAIMLEESGAVTRRGGVFVALTCGVILFAVPDIGSSVPKAILGGTLAYLGAMILVELRELPARATRVEWTFGVAIMLVICNFGYLQGVAAGLIAACLMFAISYSRIGVIRRHLTRQEFSSNVERAPQRLRILHKEGERIHVFWLSGFIFFGSSNGLFEYIRQAIEVPKEKPIGYIVLDFSAVPGLDTSAVLSLIKLRSLCNEHGITLAFSGLAEQIQLNFQKAGFFTNGQSHQVFGSLNEAIEWCEDMILAEHTADEGSTDGFESWLLAELGGAHDLSRITPYLELHELKTGEALFRQGDPPNSIEILASGRLAAIMKDEHGQIIRLRRMVGYTVVGEMGFYRRFPRTATIIAEEASVLYRLTREAFDRMEANDPPAASLFQSLIIRLLSDRLESSDRSLRHMS